MDLHPILQGKEEGWGVLFSKVAYKVNEHVRSQIDDVERANVQVHQDFSPNRQYFSPIHRDLSPHQYFMPPIDTPSRPSHIKCLLFLLFHLFMLFLLYDFTYRCFYLCRNRSIFNSIWGRKLSPVESAIKYICR